MQSNLTLRPFQKSALEAFLKPSHVICVAPTGSGKSLIYERLAHKRDTRMILVSPLIALARQQFKKLEALRIPVALAAGPDPEPPPEGKAGVWIVSPERLSSAASERRLREWRPDTLVVDECHCLWDWGENFRPAFAEIPQLLKAHEITRSLWLTATLPKSARTELISALPAPIVEIGEFELPPKLQLRVERVAWPDRATRLTKWIASQNEPGIVFVQTREASTRVARLIRATGKTSAIYHAGLSAEERRNTEAMIGQKLPDVIIATSAFGMGMDHPHLKWALLWQAPPSLLALAQAIGRAGRDSDTVSHAVIFWDREDFHLLEWCINNSVRRRNELICTLQFLESVTCRSQALKKYFDECAASSLCTQCDFCSSVQILSEAKNS